MLSEKVKLAIAPIAWTNDDMPDLGSENTFEQCVSEMALAGFTGTEVGNKYPKDTAVLKKALELRGLNVAVHGLAHFLQLNHSKKLKRSLLSTEIFFMQWEQR